MSRFRELETFVAVVEAGSMSAAAERLGVAVSAVSRRIADLERRLGVRLANRSTRGFSPTPLGLEYHARAERLLADLAEADAAASGACAAVSGTLRVAVPLSFGLRRMSPVIEGFAREFPGVTLDVDLSDRRVDLVEEGIDLAIRIGLLEDSRLVARRLFDVRHALVASADYWQREGTPGTPQELAGHTALWYRTGGPRPRWRWRDLDGDMQEVRLTPRLIANNGELLMQAAIAGLGVTREPAFIVQPAIDDGRLREVLCEVDWDPMSAWIVYPQGRALPLRARHFMDRLVATFADGVAGAG